MKHSDFRSGSAILHSAMREESGVKLGRQGPGAKESSIIGKSVHCTRRAHIPNFKARGALAALRAIKLAIARWCTPDVVNTDRESQFTANEFTDAAQAQAQAQGCELIIDRRGAWRDNVFV